MTYSELLEKAYANGMNCAEVALGQMMDIVEEETGKFPGWSDAVPEWVIKNFNL